MVPEQGLKGNAVSVGGDAIPRLPPQL